MTRMAEIAASPNAEVKRYQNVISGTSGYRASTPMAAIRPARCDFLLVFSCGVSCLNEVNARRARLALGWMTVFGRVYQLGM